ncbi:MAG: Guanylate kinase [Planctomycetota bacterium]|jgi:guanylate kinase
MARGLLLVLSGPSGVGKTTIAHELIRRFGGHFSVSCTTRPPSTGERDGVDYHFISEGSFAAMVRDDAFLEHATVFGRSSYGTPRAAVESWLAEGELVVLDIDVQGAEQVHARVPDMLGVFILPPSEQVLLERLRSRAREDETAIQRRFAESQLEMARARANGVYDAFVVNDDLAGAIEHVAELVGTRLGRVDA